MHINLRAKTWVHVKREVYEAVKCESKNGDFVYQVQQDFKDIKISMSEEAMRNGSNNQWKIIVKRQVKLAALEYLIKEKNIKIKLETV